MRKLYSNPPSALFHRVFFSCFFICVFCFSGYGQNVVYSDLYNSDSFNNKSINVSLSVGATAGTAGASAGAGTYSIPIAVPPGTNGVLPTISINYNSMGGNGLLGMGWTIGGMSAISRVNQTNYYDDATRAIDLTLNDRFALDGARLIGLSGAYGNDNATYATENETFASIVSKNLYNVVGTGYFTVKTKEGILIEFGNTTDSRMTEANQDHTITWRLNKIQYPDGNYIEYVYEGRRDSRFKNDQVYRKCQYRFSALQ